jgi:hypothetical protein
MPAFNQEEYYQQVDREIRISISKFNEHLLSNSKWKKLVEQIVNNAHLFKKIEFKKVQNKEIGELFINGDTTFEFDYWSIGFEGNNSMGGWLIFKEIEYIFFPRIINSDKSFRKI